MIKAVIETLLYLALLWIASYYGSNDSLLPPVWWIIASGILLFRVYDIFTAKKPK